MLQGDAVESRLPMWPWRQGLNVLSLILGLTSCVSTSEPEATGGRLLSGTTGISSAEPSIRVSPDGAWLLRQEVGSTPTNPRFAFYDLADGRSTTILISREAAESLNAGSTALTWLANWRPTGLTATLPVGTAGKVLEAKPTSPSPSWVNSTSLQSVSSTQADNSDGQQRFRARGQGSRNVELVDTQDANKAIVQHKGLLQGNLTIEHVSISSDGSSIGYTLSAGRGFTGPTQGFVACVAMGSRPRLLAAPIAGGIEWNPASKQVFAAARGSSGKWGVYAWEIQPCD